MLYDARVDKESTLSKRLKVTSLLKRAILGTLLLVFGIFGSAWLFDASIEKPSARFAVPQLSPDNMNRY
ncbi:MAG: hypothetical protein HRT83_02870 [Hyphomicrobiaceae bacterium]|nr:hypothetical protein [Hyphomicrobiaceae bacterium]